FDTKTKLKGGSGKKFDWKVLKNYHLDHPFFLSGGIAPEDAEIIQQLELNNLFAIDINSKFENKPADKNLQQIDEFINKIKNKQPWYHTM
ncbi:MAG: phosphoribosylanthranilate isomerase, partial [Cyclobacteriaceae bacterium]